MRDQNGAARCSRVFERSKVAGLALLAAIAAVMVATPAQAAFPGQNGRIAYYRFFGDPTVIDTLRADGSHLKRLPTGGGKRWLAFDSRQPDDTLALMVMRPDGTGRRTIIHRGGAFPDWSPDGTHLLFSGTIGSSRTLLSVSADGTDRVNLTPTSRADEWLGACSHQTERRSSTAEASKATASTTCGSWR